MAASFTVTFVVIDYIDVRGGDRARVLEIVVLRLFGLLHHHRGRVVGQVVPGRIADRAVVHHLTPHLSLDDVGFLRNICVLLLLPIDPPALLVTLVVQNHSRVHLGICDASVLHLLVPDLLESEGKEGAQDGTDEDDEEDDHDDHTDVDWIGNIGWTLLHNLSNKGDLRQQGAQPVEGLDLIVHCEVYQAAVER